MAIREATIEATYERMAERLGEFVPDFELRTKAELVYEIERLKVERNAVILGHNYMEPALFHTVPDIVGDSLELSRRAAQTDKDVIVFCGVRFMAETAKILSPDKTVLVPSSRAGCSLAESITAADVRALKERFPGIPVVTYINTYADVKAECDICCTSSNAAAVVDSLDSDTVIFLPDEFLARNVARDTGKRIMTIQEIAAAGDRMRSSAGAEMISWNGRCEVHEIFEVADVRSVRKQFPDVEVLAHPECSPEVVEASDFSGSTTAMIRHVQSSEASRFLLLTECSMGDNIIAESSGKDILRLCSHRCPHMAEITLEETLAALRELRFEIDLPAETIERARGSVMRMLEIKPSAAALPSASAPRSAIR